MFCCSETSGPEVSGGTFIGTWITGTASDEERSGAAGVECTSLWTAVSVVVGLRHGGEVELVMIVRSR